MTLRYVLFGIAVAIAAGVAVAEFWIPLFRIIAACHGDCRASLGG